MTRTSQLEAPSGVLHDVASSYWPLLEQRAKFPGARLIRIFPGWREQPKPRGAAARLFAEHLSTARSVLEVGAGDRYWGKVLGRLGIDADYRSADIEKQHRHDYGDFLEVRERFDAVLMLELIEHLPLELGLRFIEHAIDLLTPGGTLVIGTPNAHHPHWVWSSCVTHVRPWPAQDLWAACVIGGLWPVEVYRQMLVSRRRVPLLPLQLALSRVLSIDPAQGILLFARKPRDS
jgi:SAM-dependent methyltransferase